jgi:aryl-alcohol dehydrogenase-like predicted oxidoreductase
MCMLSRAKVQIATKFAFYQDENNNRSVLGEPEYVPACYKASLKWLDLECIDLYYQHCLDPKVPIEINVRINLASTLRGHTLDKICKHLQGCS